MRIALTLSFGANLVLGLISVAILPERMAIHFAWGGAADGWASRLDSTLLTFALKTLLFSTFWLVPALLRWTPAKWVNLPNRAYMTEPP